MLSNRRREPGLQKEKRQRAKIYLIVGLGIVFCTVGYVRFFYNKPAAVPATAGGALSRPAPVVVPAPVVPAVNVQLQAPAATEPPKGGPGTGETMRPVTRNIFEPGKAAMTAMAKAKPASTDKASRDREAAAEIQLVLNGMIYSSSNPIAIINGTFHRVGDTIGAFKVASIGAREVLLKGEDREITLRIIDNVQK